MKFTLLCLATAGITTAAKAWGPVTPVAANSKNPPTASSHDAFSLYEIPNPAYPGLDVPSSVIKAHIQHGSVLPPAIVQAIEINPKLNQQFKFALGQGSSSATVPAYPGLDDSQYVVPVLIGTPPQTVYVAVDTGSSDFWVFTSDTYEPAQAGHEIYQPDDSSTSKFQQGEHWVVKYGDGSGASGNVYTDIVRLGATSFSGQAIQSATNVSSSIAADPFSSGILGFASSTANTILPNRSNTYIQNILPQLEAPVFTANLHMGEPGNYNFGYINQSEYQGKITYAAMDPDVPYYQISVAGFQVGAAGGFQSHTWTAIVDTGTSQLLVPQPVVDAYYAKVPGTGTDVQSGMLVFPCSAPLPDFTFGIGAYRGIIPGSYINYGSSNATHCFGGIQTSQGMPFGVLGDTLLKSQFVVFDLGSLQVGFAAKPTQ